MNAIDLLFILLVLAGLAVGFFQGTIKLIIAIVAFYVSIVLASLYFQIVGRFFRQRFGTTLEVGQITAFAFILLVAFLLLTIAGLYTFRYARVPAGLDFVDRVLGTLFGLVLGALILGIFASLLESLFVFRNPVATITFPIMRAFQSAVRSSILVQFFANTILPLIYSSVRPVLPAEADLIFRVR
jgi:uncharacterized membrane protein required for colicin V production